MRNENNKMDIKNRIHEHDTAEDIIETMNLNLKTDCICCTAEDKTIVYHID